MRIDIYPASHNRHRLQIHGTVDGPLLTTETLDIHNSRQREKLTDRLVERFDLNRATVEDQMQQALREVVSAEESAMTTLEGSEIRSMPYVIHEGCICLGGATLTQLANFTAQIVEEVVIDDGVEQVRHFDIEGVLANSQSLPRVRVAAKDYESMDWVVPRWGPLPTITAGRSNRDHLRAAIQMLSVGVRVRKLYQHTGWRNHNGQWVYLHAAGAIGAGGVVPGIESVLPAELQRFVLPPPPTGNELVLAIHSSLQLLDVGPDRISVPLFAAIYRAVLGGTDFSLHFSGKTGGFKSSFQALAQQHYGSGMDPDYLPANWESTANSLEVLAFYAKDVLLLVDEFCPKDGPKASQELHAKADRVLRAQGNHSGRQRLTADETLRPVKPPRGLILSNGEDTPKGESLRARIWVVDVANGDIQLERLVAAQAVAAAGHYAASLAGFVQWVAWKGYDCVKEHLRTDFQRLRAEIQSAGLHARTPGIAANLLVGVQFFVWYAQECGALIEADAAIVMNRCRTALCASMTSQRIGQNATDPVQKFIDLIASGLATGRARLESLGECTINAASAGRRSLSNVAYECPVIGWLDGSDVYLEPIQSFAFAQRLADEQHDSITLTRHTLGKRLREDGHLVTEESQGGNLHRLPAPNRKIRGWRLQQGVLRIRESDNDTETGTLPNAG